MNEPKSEGIVSVEERLVIEASNRRLQIKQALSYGSAWFLEAGRLLSEAIEKKDYEALGYENQYDYFKSEFNIGVSTGYNLMGIWKTFKGIPIKEVAQAGYTRLTKLLPLAKHVGEDEKKEWIHRAITLPPGEFENAIKESKGKPATDACDHDFKTLLVCKKCGLKVVN